MQLKDFFKSSLEHVIFEGIDLNENQDYSIDSRTIVPGQIFVAIKGNNVDGHDYINEVLKKGATGFIISKDKSQILDKIDSSIKSKLFIAIVDDPQNSLIQLAKNWRKKFNLPIIGITGSIGKTSTKELICNIFTQANKKYLSSYGNQNTAIGISLNILKLRNFHEVAIFEMGISKRGEMAKMTDIVKPTIGIITYVGHSHMSGLGNVDDIANEKKDIFKYFKDDNIGIINGDQPVIASISYRHPTIKFGSKTINQIQARKIKINHESIDFDLKLYNKKYNVNLKTNHTGRVYQSLAAISVGHILSVDTPTILKAIEMPITIDGRFNKKSLKDQKGYIIDDSYNASPESMKAAIFAFDKLESKGKKIAILGDMLELGHNSAFWHRQLGRLLKKAPTISHVIFVGEMVKLSSKTLPENIKAEYVGNWSQALELLKQKIEPEVLVLVKGSRSIQLNKIVENISQ
ncbi:UDP-N-acetylmuramoyl-tripeptide--D-alanyl-D-alanine ligase [Candidatus Dependentiae bacterium]|nr:UDP-N-acetylmuramoyl-tripeptide--D-alanyl-D-alanine ligase [Candidatus Dependentiae bacterium]